MKSLKIFLSALSILFFSYSVSATHVVGGNINYEALGGSSYLVTLELFSSCDIAVGFGASQNISVESSCGATAYYSIPVIDTTSLNPLCASSAYLTTCNGGTLPGYNIYIFEGLVTLDTACASSIISYTSCCRSATNNVSNANFSNEYLAAVVYTGVSTTNNSPYFSNNDMPFFCYDGTAQTFDYFIQENDGDSLVFELIEARSNHTTALMYSTGYTGALPISAISINAATGAMTFNPTSVGMYIVVVSISEYDANGNLLGTNYRDLNFFVVNCSAAASPLANSGATTSGNASTNGNTVTVCSGEYTCTDFVLTHPDSTQVMTVLSETFHNMPGGTVSYSGTNPVTITVCWTASGTGTPAPYFEVTLNTDSCPLPAQQTFDLYYDITNPIADAVVNYTVPCSCDSLYLVSTYTDPNWNYSWTPAANLANPNSPTTYINNTNSPETYTLTVTDANGGACMDTATVYVPACQLPSTGGVTGPNAVPVNTIATFDVSTFNGSSFDWSTDGGTIQQGQGTTTIEILWTAPISGMVRVAELDPSGCAGDTTEFLVTSTPNSILESEAPTFKVGPNPFSANLLIQPSNASNYTLFVYDARGRVLLTSNGQGLRQIDGSSLQSGIYLVELRFENGAVARHRVVKQ